MDRAPAVEAGYRNVGDTPGDCLRSTLEPGVPKNCELLLGNGDAAQMSVPADAVNPEIARAATKSARRSDQIRP